MAETYHAVKPTIVSIQGVWRELLGSLVQLPGGTELELTGKADGWARGFATHSALPGRVAVAIPVERFDEDYTIGEKGGLDITVLSCPHHEEHPGCPACLRKWWEPRLADLGGDDFIKRTEPAKPKKKRARKKAASKLKAAQGVLTGLDEPGHDVPPGENAADTGQSEQPTAKKKPRRRRKTTKKKSTGANRGKKATKKTD